MQEKEFIALVDKLESYAREHPAAYKLRVALLAALGYLFLATIVAGSLFIIIGVFFAGRINYLVIKLLIIPIALVVVVLRSLCIKFPVPEGHELKYADAPHLFALVKGLRSATNGPSVHKVLLTDDYNAGIVQRPRLGMLGWPQNYLLVGLPLLRALSPNDVRAVIAHEFGHLSGNHGKFSGWVYRVRQTWTQIMQNVQEHGRYGSGIFKRFFDWYAPYFGAYSFVLARAQEYEADRCSVAVVGKERAARALINLELKESALNENFWPEFYKRADKQPEPPGEAYAEMLQSLREPLPPEKAQVWFSQSLTKRHRYDDTHPALGDRLEAMGYTNVRQERDVNTFASNDEPVRADQYFLARVPDGFIEQKNQWWKEQLTMGWTERHKFVLEAEQSLVTLAEKAKTTPLTIDELWDRARFMAGTQGNAAAIPFLNDVLAVMHDHAAANYTLGEALLEQDNEAGIKHIEVAMQKDFKATAVGCELICAFLTKHERLQEAEKYEQRLVSYFHEVELARHERDNILVSDNFTSHGLTPEALEALRAQLAQFPQLASAYLVRKVVKHFPDEPSYVLGIIAKHPWYSSSNEQRDQQLVNQLANNVSYPGYTFIIAMERNYKGLRKVLKQIQGSQII